MWTEAALLKYASKYRIPVLEETLNCTEKMKQSKYLENLYQETQNREFSK